MTNKTLMLFKKYKVDTDATHTNKGFLYQYLKTLIIWISNAVENNQNEIFCETEDDVKVVNFDKRKLEFTQVKCYSSNLGTQDEEIKKTIYNFFVLYNIYQEYDGNFYFETNTNIKINDNFLKEWYENQELMTEELILKCKHRIQEILKETIDEKKKVKIKSIDKKILKIESDHNGDKEKQLIEEKDSITKDFAEMLERVYDEDIITSFVKKIKWNFENIEGDKAIENLKQICVDRIIEYTGENSNLLLHRFLSEILYRAANNKIDDRKLNKSLLDKIIEETDREMINKISPFLQNLLEKTYDIEEITDSYSIKMDTFLRNNMPLPFSIDLDIDLLECSGYNDFFNVESWKEKISILIDEILKEVTFDSKLQHQIVGLQEIIKREFTYDELKGAIQKDSTQILESFPKENSHSNIRAMLFSLNKLLNNSYSKIFLITGEPGSGKSHLLKNILYSYQIDNQRKEYFINIPLLVKDIINNGLEDTILFTINKLLGTEFKEIAQLNRYVIHLDKEKVTFNVNFIIDDIQLICKSFKNYDIFKNLIINYTKYDWISWCFSINEYDQYLILDNSSFINDYCFPTSSEKNINFFIDMNKINKDYYICHNILSERNFDVSEIEEFKSNVNNIRLLLNNPLICLVYVNSVEQEDRDLLNIGYFNFILSYSKIKKEQMIGLSNRHHSVKEKSAYIDLDLKKVVEFLIDNKKLIYLEDELDNLQVSLKDCFNELSAVHLFIKEIKEFENDLESYTEINYKFIFELFWAYKILMKVKNEEKWEIYSEWRKSFVDLKDQLLIYELLYLDRDFSGNIDIINQEIEYALNSLDEKAIVLFLGVKTSFDTQGLIFNKLLGPKLNLNKQETFALLYFLMNTNAKNATGDKKCEVLSKYLDDISMNELSVYAEALFKKILSSFSKPSLFKKCISQFIKSTNTDLNERLGKIAAEKFSQIIEEKKYDLRIIFKDNIIKYLEENTLKLEESSRLFSKEKKSLKVTFIEYFLRYLFSYLIGYYKTDELKLHSYLMENNYYYYEANTLIGNILRNSSANAYGAYYKHLPYSKKILFKEKYIELVEELINKDDGKGSPQYRIFAFHFIINTIHFNSNIKSELELEFIPLLERIYKDHRLRKFNEDRKKFYSEYFSK